MIHRDLPDGLLQSTGSPLKFLPPQIHYLSLLWCYTALPWCHHIIKCSFSVKIFFSDRKDLLLRKVLLRTFLFSKFMQTYVTIRWQLYGVHKLILVVIFNFALNLGIQQRNKKLLKLDRLGKRSYFRYFSHNNYIINLKICMCMA